MVDELSYRSAVSFGSYIYAVLLWWDFLRKVDLPLSDVEFKKDDKKTNDCFLVPLLFLPHIIFVVSLRCKIHDVKNRFNNLILFQFCVYSLSIIKSTLNLNLLLRNQDLGIRFQYTSKSSSSHMAVLRNKGFNAHHFIGLVKKNRGLTYCSFQLQLYPETCKTKPWLLCYTILVDLHPIEL